MLITHELNRLPTAYSYYHGGNGRRETRRNLSRFKGHKAGAANTREAIKTFNSYYIKYLTIYAFSIENWNRPEDEIKGLFES